MTDGIDFRFKRCSAKVGNEDGLLGYDSALLFDNLAHQLDGFKIHRSGSPFLPGNFLEETTGMF